jgi:hypothetical protein
MLAQISLTDHERASVKDGSAAVERLVARLANTPTPMSRTPHALAQFADLVALSSLQVSVQAPPTTQQENA